MNAVRVTQVLRLILPASVIAEYQAALCRFMLQSFSEKEVSDVEFFQRMLDCEEKSQRG